MPKGTIFKDNTSIQRSFSRKSLSEIQLTADEERLVRNMICSEDKVSLKQSKTAAKIITVEKENAPIVRRSKRKTTKAENITYVASPLDLKPSKSKNTKVKKTVTKSKKSRPDSSNKPQTAIQTKLNFSPIRTDPPKQSTCVSESDNTEKHAATVTDDDSGFDPSGGIVDHSPMNSTAILRTPHVKSSAAIPDRISVIVADIPPLSYWKDLAEERRIALDKALHENELLHDQLTVLEAENAQLKHLLKEAENLAEVVRAIVN